MNYKKIIRILLLLFLTLSVGVLIYKNVNKKEITQEKTRISQKEKNLVTVYYFHGNTRCKTCRTIEEFTQNAVKDFDFKIPVKLNIINIEKPENEHFIKDFKLTFRSVVISYTDKNSKTKWERMDKVWKLVKNETDFVNYIRNGIKNITENNA